MLIQSDFPLADALGILAKQGIEAAFIVTTPTGLEKSILDATGGLREYLRQNEFHDFGAQGQGPEHKAQHDVYFVRPRSLERSTASLYRPNTKSGDPRIWLGIKTRENVSAYNLLALTIQSGQLYALNMSDPAVRSSLEDAASPFRKVVDAIRTRSPAAEELLCMLGEVSRLGFIKTLRPGDTGVGFTLETNLGIAANSNQAPDFKGIELKAKRNRKAGRANRSTLFAKVPNWKLSPVGNAKGLLNRRGYIDKNERLALYHTLRGDKANSLGLALEIDGDRDWLKQVYLDPTTGKVEHDVTWEIPILKRNLAAKHRETFWVTANCRGRGEDEEFHYVGVQQTQRPLVGNLPALFEAGIVTVDYALHLKGDRARDHGYLFKIHPQNLGTLFPSPEEHVIG